MIGHTNLDYLLVNAEPRLDEVQYVFASFPGAKYADLAWMKPLASMQEKEGLTLVIERTVAERAGVPIECIFSRISLDVHSSLESVGLTAAIAARLAAQGISANIIAGFYHDHVFIPQARGNEALQALGELRESP